MKLIFISNTFGHYQIPLCQRWNELCDFHFITTKPMSEATKKLGFTDWSEIYPYVINAWESDAARQHAIELCTQADVVVAGACEEYYLAPRLKENNLTSHFTERIFKKGKNSLLKPKNFSPFYRQHTANRKKNYYILCTGADAASDFRFVGMPKEKLLRWGYFPEVPELDMEQVLKQRGDDVIQIVWVGRLVELKHPDRALSAAKYLKDNGVRFEMKLIGMGPLEEKLRMQIKDNHIEDCVFLTGSMPSEKVREMMRASHIFLLNSDKREGWGAVVSEAMGSGCAAVISDEAGAARVLICNGENGVYYPCNDGNALNEALYRVAVDKMLRERISRNAYTLMRDEWNGTAAAERLCRFSEQLLAGEHPNQPKNGPLSPACEEQR